MDAETLRLHAELEDDHWWFAARRRILLDLVRRLVPPDPDEVLVDLGCGTGGNLAALARDYDAVGLEDSLEALELARRRVPDARLVHGSRPADLGEDAARARLFLLADVLEHVADDFELLSDLLSRAREGAHVVITVPAAPELWSPHDEAFGHLRRYDRARLERLWSGLPVEPLLVSPFNARLYPLIRLARRASGRSGRARGEAGTDFRRMPRSINALLRAVFAGEGPHLVRALHGGPPYAQGLSLIAVLRRAEGPVAVRRRPDDLPADERPRSGRAPAA